MNNEFLTPEQAAELAGVTPKTLIQWRKVKGLRSFTVVGKIRYKRDDILQFIKPKEMVNKS